MRFIQKSKIITRQYVIDMFYTDKVRKTMYGLNLDREHNKLELIGYNNGKIHHFLFNAVNLFKNPEVDILGFQAFVYDNNAYLKVFTGDPGKEDADIMTHEYLSDKDNVLGDMFKVKIGGYGDVFSLIGEKGSTKVYRLEVTRDIYGKSIQSKGKNYNMFLSYCLIYRDNERNAHKKIIPSQLPDAVPKSNVNYLSTWDHVRSSVYIGKEYFYLYERYQQKTATVNVVSVYDKTGRLIKVIDPHKYVVFPNLFEFPSRYVYYIDKKLRGTIKHKPRFHIFDVETLKESTDRLPKLVPEMQDSAYHLPHFDTAVFDDRTITSLSKRSTVTPAMLEKFHISADGNGHFVIYVDSNRVITYHAYSYSSGPENTEDYGHLSFVYYIIDNNTSKHCFSFLGNNGKPVLAVKNVSEIFNNTLGKEQAKMKDGAERE